jgi:signal transduction histidine kinase
MERSQLARYRRIAACGRHITLTIERTIGPSVRLELQLGVSVRKVLIDANQLESAILNLAINARDAMPEGGMLSIATTERTLGPAELSDHEGTTPGDFVEIGVADSGYGMSPDVLPRVFEPFFTTKPTGEGTGLGLSQVYGFVRQSGGVVRLERARPRHNGASLSAAKQANRGDGGSAEGARRSRQSIGSKSRQDRPSCRRHGN